MGEEEVLLIETRNPNFTDYLPLDDHITGEWSMTTPRTSKEYVWTPEVKERITVVAIIMVCTIVGNSVLMLMLLCKQSRRIKRVNVFLVNLAIGDIAVALITNTTEILFLAFGDWALGPVLCKLSVYLQIVTLASATFLLTAMSIDRYQVIVKPMQTLANRPRIWLKVTVAWTMAFVFALPQLAIFVQVNKGVKYDGTPKRLCLSRGYTEEWQRKFYFTFMTTYILLVPACVMLFCYTNIITVVWARASTNEHPSSKSHSLYGKKRPTPTPATTGQDYPRISVRRGLVTASKRRAIVMTLTVIIGFLVCLTPYFIVTLMRIYSNYKLKLKDALVVSENIFMTHSALNPVLYGLFTLRPKHLKRIGRCLCCSSRNTRKSSEKNRLINGGTHRKCQASEVTFKTKAKRIPLPPPEVTNDLVAENTHALMLLDKGNTTTSVGDGYERTIDAKRALCSESYRKYGPQEQWMASRKINNDECLSAV
ncbi:neuropeptide S receptor-like [Haliotis rufescens]|uniref:neuropeptide S receptor-like n=1 Tax=Haliotis rufescens TaxID=6454 RepID=UPI001EB06C06|nr:neuropeptide S receptor-like [Haliotis rufescens]XP_046336480.1 neuropeptide S receptor-like [Haliotis rufescens]